MTTKILQKEKIMCLKPNTWLNDEVVLIFFPVRSIFDFNTQVINFYMSMLQERDAVMCERTKRSPSHFFNSFFMERLLITDNRYNYRNVQRWSKKFDVFEVGPDIFILQFSFMEILRSEGQNIFPSQHFQHALDLGCSIHSRSGH